MNIISNLSVSRSNQARECLSLGHYMKAIDLYEQEIDELPEDKSSYWYLGLALLLQGQETEAQTVWLTAISDVEPERIEVLTLELIDVLEEEANNQTKKNDYKTAWIIRQHIRELAPNNVDNLLMLIDLGIEIRTFTGSELNEYEIITILKTDLEPPPNPYLILHTIKKLLLFLPIHENSFDLIQVAIKYIQEKEEIKEDFIRTLIPFVYQLSYVWVEKLLAIKYCYLGLTLFPIKSLELELIRALACFYVEAGEYKKSVEFSKKCLALSENLPNRIYDNHQTIRAMLYGTDNCWSEVLSHIQEQENMINELFQAQYVISESSEIVRLYNSTFYFPYLQDDPEKILKLRRQVTELCQRGLNSIFPKEIKKYQEANQLKKQTKVLDKPLKIGYLSHCLRRHSVGWLTRCLFAFHNRDDFQIHTYMVAANIIDPMKDWYVKRSDKSYQYELENWEIAEQIHADGIDILIDLDSLTFNNTCLTVALKPAPVQVTWLGWDASEIPVIDYFIADPYVLPENANNYYHEKIWRLPETYLAVDGFPIDTPSLRRESLNIPADAIVYFSSQAGHKYNPQMLNLQMQIVKEVSNSYFVIKTFGKEDAIQNLFLEVAEKIGLEGTRLRFITEKTPSEEIHRANMMIADVVLDTYPYNGATTTMETLWLGIPMVTKVGQQFAARNSYTMMMNAGITQGIAWTDEEYVEWGVKFGKDENLRREVSWKLRESRKTSPLWNGEQFTKEMEKAYQQMWQIYLDGGKK